MYFFGRCKPISRTALTPVSPEEQAKSFPPLSLRTALGWTGGGAGIFLLLQEPLTATDSVWPHILSPQFWAQTPGFNSRCWAQICHSALPSLSQKACYTQVTPL